MTRIRSLIRRTILAWTCWRFRRIARPLADLHRIEREAAMARDTRAIGRARKAKRAFVLSQLREFAR